MIAYTFLVIVAAVALFAFWGGCIEARGMDENEEINHGRLAVTRASFIVAICSIAAFVGMSAKVLLLIPGMCAWLAIVHRITLNTSRKRIRLPFYYMGPAIRGAKESWYDTQWYRLAATAQHTSVFTQERTTVRYEVARKWLPWLYATLFELSILALSTWGYIHYQ